MTAQRERLIEFVWVKRSTLALIAWASVIIMAGILPLSNFVGHSHWEYIEWRVPSSQWYSARFYFDVAANIALYYPFGLLLTRRFQTTPWPVLIAGGLMLSMGVETSQVYCHNRHPSPVDVFTNLSGTVLGVLTPRKWFRVRWFGRQSAS